MSMLKSLHGEKGLARKIKRAARHLEKEELKAIIEDKEKLQKALEERDADEAERIALKITGEDVDEFLDELESLDHEAFQEEFKHLVELRRLKTDLQDLHPDADIGDVYRMVEEIRKEIEDSLKRYLSGFQRLKDGAAPESFNITKVQDIVNNTRDIKNFAKKLYKVVRKVSKAESNSEKEARKEEINHEELRNEVDSLHSLITGEKKLMDRLIIYSMFDLYGVIAFVQDAYNLVDSLPTYPRDSKAAIKNNADEVKNKVGMAADKLQNEVRKLMSKSTRV